MNAGWIWPTGGGLMVRRHRDRQMWRRRLVLTLYRIGSEWPERLARFIDPCDWVDMGGYLTYDPPSTPGGSPTPRRLPSKPPTHAT